MKTFVIVCAIVYCQADYIYVGTLEAKFQLIERPQEVKDLSHQTKLCN